jgi:hypothetical protein
MAPAIELDPALFGRLAISGFELALAAPAGAAKPALRDEWLEAARVLKEMAGTAPPPWEAALSEMRGLRPPLDPHHPVFSRGEQLLLDALKQLAGPPPQATQCLAEVVSLVSLCPAYLIDAAPLSPPLQLRRVAPGESGRLGGQTEPLDDYAVLADGGGIIVTPSRQYDHGRPGTESRNLLLLLFAPQAGARLQRALALAEDLVIRHLETRPGPAFRSGI